jgi:transcriptional regulator GlxA family with amidase domain
MQLTYLLYPDIEPIDLAPLGVFSMGRRIIPSLGYQLVAPSKSDPVKLSNGLHVVPDLSFDDVKAVDVLLVPGGAGWKAASQHTPTLDFIRRWAPDATLVSICTGSLILAAAGVLDGLAATTKCRVVAPEKPPMDELRGHASITTKQALLVDNGKVITGGGVSLCIDTTLYLISRRYGEDAANRIAQIMEYDAARAANADRLPLLSGDDLVGAVSES